MDNGKLNDRKLVTADAKKHTDRERTRHQSGRGKFRGLLERLTCEKGEKLQEVNVKMVGQKREERLSYLSKGDSVVEEGMGLVDSGW